MIPKNDMTNAVVVGLTENQNPHDQLTLIRRHWGNLDRAHPQNDFIREVLQEARKSVPLWETMFPFERPILMEYCDFGTVYAALVLPKDETNAGRFIWDSLTPAFRVFCRTEEDAKAATREFWDQPNKKVVYPVDDGKDGENIMFYWYDRRGFYEAVYSGQGIVSEGTVYTFDGGEWFLEYP